MDESIGGGLVGTQSRGQLVEPRQTGRNFWLNSNLIKHRFASREPVALLDLQVCYPEASREV